MTINLFGVNWDLVAMTIYLFATFISTEFIKKKIKLHPVIISWIIGAILFILIALWSLYNITFMLVIQYIFLTLALNGGYKLYTKFLRRSLK